MAKQTSPRPTSSPTATNTAPKSPAPKKKRVSEPPQPMEGLVSTAARGKAEPSHHDIAQRAFALYQARGQSGGDPVHDWLTAERELAN
jgi:hypothetical protein